MISQDEDIIYYTINMLGGEQIDLDVSKCMLCGREGVCCTYKLCHKQFSICQDCSNNHLLYKLCSNISTELVDYPCPSCGKYNKPYMHSKGYAMMVCSQCGKQYRTSVKVSSQFRKFCSEVAKKPNRSQSYYTSFESKVRDILLENGYREGIDFIHNVRVPLKVEGKTRYYWLDFYIPHEDLVIECNPKIWHHMWNRQTSDRVKYELLEKEGLKILLVSERNIKEINRYLKWVTHKIKE